VKFSRGNIYLRDHNRCQYCGKKFSSSELSLDHVMPISRGGKSTWENVVCACLPCNVRRATSCCRVRHAAHPAAARPKWHPLPSPAGTQLPGHLEELPRRGYWNVELRTS
jgi:hypothetical protein